MKRVATPLFGCALLVILGPVSSAVADPTKLPCDIYADDGGPCVAAHSTVRLLSSTYTGPLYQVRREGTNGGKTQDIGVAAGGFADAAAQDLFCGTRRCTISIIYDQSGMGNHLKASMSDYEAKAKLCPITINGHNVYGERHDYRGNYGVRYRKDRGNGTATGDDAETIYMVASGTYYNSECCFEYGNVQIGIAMYGAGSTEAIYFGKFSAKGKGLGNGPWVMADLGNGMWAGTETPFDNDPSVTYRYVTAMVKAGSANTNHMTVKIGDAQSGGLTKVFDGRRASIYDTMKKGGGITLGADGKDSASGVGNFFEGVMTARYSSDAADNAVQANIVSVYGH